MGDGACISIAQEAALARARIKAIDPTLDLEAERAEEYGLLQRAGEEATTLSATVHVAHDLNR